MQVVSALAPCSNDSRHPIPGYDRPRKAIYQEMTSSSYSFREKAMHKTYPLQADSDPSANKHGSPKQQTTKAQQQIAILMNSPSSTPTCHCAQESTASPIDRPRRAGRPVESREIFVLTVRTGRKSLIEGFRAISRVYRAMGLQFRPTLTRPTCLRDSECQHDCLVRARRQLGIW